MPTIPFRRPAVRAAAFMTLIGLPALAACSGDVPQASATTTPVVDYSTLPTAPVVDSLLPNVTEAVGTAGPLLSATLSTRLMATVLDVHVQEGDAVREGQLLLTLDVRDVDARAAQAQGQLAGAEAMLADAELQAARMRALFADSAAPRAQLDAAEAGLARG